MQTEWERLRAEAGDDPQKVGHEGEGIWVDLLSKWLPSSYEVAKRKYILSETDDAPHSGETDIVIFSPGYPEALRERAEVLAGGVAAAFYSRLTLDADSIRDATKRAVDTRRRLEQRYDTVRGEMLGPFPVGLLSPSHCWKGARSTPFENVTNAFVARDDELVNHPRECLDLICVADLATWYTVRNPWMQVGDQGPRCLTSAMSAHPELSPTPIAGFVMHLLRRLSYADPSLRPMAAGLWALNLLGGGGGRAREWELDHVFSDRVLQQLPGRLEMSDPDWLAVYI
jgi:hypothetical protein